MEQTIFYTLALVILCFSVLSVTTLRVLRAAVYLLFALGSTAAIYFMVDYFFLAAVQLLVYVGGIVVLIIFSILLTSQINELLQRPEIIKIAATLALALIGSGITIISIWQYKLPQGSPDIISDTSVAEIGARLLNYGEGGYVLPFEVISILLLAAMIGAIIIAKKSKQND